MEPDYPAHAKTNDRRAACKSLFIRAGARQIVLFHHQPDRTDDELDKIAERFARAPVPVTVAAQEQVIDL